LITDTAHRAAQHLLQAGDPSQAAAAALVAVRAGDPSDVAMLDLVQACDAQGNNAQADEWVRRIMDNHDAEIEEDLPPRTFAALTARSRRDSRM
jgi:hypothetical protein